ncbi:transporter substrate-binding domain-containing protein [Desulfopila sp. IMCC35006]|uniref:transporter substrate-binding domain-containing protein n=1 Tax=Desulfopila sp. IMCC35006 TaxID=2569542 RepID=UPI00142EAF57|nr:transporter substrate-binding domain-containing protein [Desulfopila sp. IMCC35006]
MQTIETAQVKNHNFRKKLVIFVAVFMLCLTAGRGWSGDLDEVLQKGTLRHLGIVYANFVTEDKMGLDVELMQLFAAHLGVKYQFVETSWQNVITDLTGTIVKPNGNDIAITGKGAIRGDIIATGFTVLDWRKKIVDFSSMTFPTGVWLISRADSALQPIVPTSSIAQDVDMVKASLKGVSVLGLKDSCLDPDLYHLDRTGAVIELFPSDSNLDQMIPAVIARKADTTLMDVPVALIALEKWPGRIKVIGPVSAPQTMACAFPKTSPKLRAAFEEFFSKAVANGTYKALVRKYYPSLFQYYPDVF